MSANETPATDVNAEMLQRALDLLADAAELGLTFERGRVYISAEYVELQEAMRARIEDLRREAGHQIS